MVGLAKIALLGTPDIFSSRTMQGGKQLQSSAKSAALPRPAALSVTANASGSRSRMNGGAAAKPAVDTNTVLASLAKAVEGLSRNMSENTAAFGELKSHLTRQHEGQMGLRGGGPGSGKKKRNSGGASDFDESSYVSSFTNYADVVREDMFRRQKVWNSDEIKVGK